VSDAICQPPTIFERHRARRLAIWNGAIWAVGNGLASTTLVFYLAGELHAKQFGLGIGLILAAPHVAGLLQLGAPAMIGRLAGRKRFCLAAFFLSALVLLALPCICSPGLLPSPGWSLAAMISLWCLYHVLQYLGMVALWAWLADIAPTPIRGRYLGRRQRWMVAGTAAAALAAGFFAWGWHACWPDAPRWIPYGLMAELGACFMLAALSPMASMPACVGKTRHVATQRNNAASWKTPFRDGRFLRLLLFGCLFSLVNGVTQSAQNYYPLHILGVSLFVSLALQTGMNLGQCGVSPWLGRMADRRGNRPVMFACQWLVAAGMLFYAVATPAQWWWIVGAWIFWIAYAGLNVCLPNLTLKLASPGAAASYTAAFQAAGGFCYAVGSIFGGALVDRFSSGSHAWLLFFPCLFLFGWFARSAVAMLIPWIVEPAKQKRI
jgi:MFS family permease